jgi:hypothetical protein
VHLPDYWDLEEVARADRDEAGLLRERIRHFRRSHELALNDEIVEWIARDAGDIYDAWSNEESRSGGELIGWRMAAEHVAMKLVDGRAYELVRACSAYLEEHSEEFGERRMNSERGEYHVSFTGDAAAHRAALHALLDDPAGLVVEQALRSEAELLRLQERISDDGDLLASLGIDLLGMGLDGRRGQVYVQYAAADPDAAAELLRDRYGEALGRGALDLHGSSQTSDVQTREWQLYSTDVTDIEITVHSIVNPTIPFERIEAAEDDDEVRVTVFERQPRGQIHQPVSADSATIKLERPVAGRRVIDGATGRRRARRARPE